MVDQLQCDSCLESSDAQKAQRVSLATPPKLWQAVKVDIFELEDSPKKVSLHNTWMQPANCRRAHAFWKEILVSVSSRTVRLSFHIWPRIGGLWLGPARVIMTKPFNNGVGRCIPRQEKLVLSGYRMETN